MKITTSTERIESLLLGGLVAFQLPEKNYEPVTNERIFGTRQMMATAIATTTKVATNP